MHNIYAFIPIDNQSNHFVVDFHNNFFQLWIRPVFEKNLNHYHSSTIVTLYCLTLMNMYIHFPILNLIILSQFNREIIKIVS